jgi:predicted kinase
MESPVDSTPPNTTHTDDDGRLARGRARIRELAVENETERQAEQAALLADLGREPSRTELLLIETTAAQVVEARKLRRLGRSSEMQDRLIELGVLSSQCLDRRIPDKQTLVEEIAAWEHDRNANRTKANWHFTTPNARIKLKHLYPSI